MAFAAFWHRRIFGFDDFIASVVFWLLRVFGFGGFGLPIVSYFLLGLIFFLVFWILYLCFRDFYHRLLAMGIIFLRLGAPLTPIPSSN